MPAHDTASAAQAYIERGWAVVPLHDVLGGSCSCGSADPRHAYKQGGKHPLEAGWQNRGIRSAAGVRDAWARRPGANLGIVTGRASGIWVLDVDPDNGGDKQLAALVSAFGPMPETYAVRTGSGGTHYYWTMPDFDFTNSRGRLPLGLDVRGNASQVVAPPSHTLKGPYAVVLDVETVAAPGWMLDMIRPAERVERDPEVRAAPGYEVPAGVAGRGASYAATAVRELLGQLAAAGVGERNQTAYRIGRRLAELVGAAWSGLDADAVWAGFMEAAAVCDVDGGFTQTEAYDVLSKACRDQQRAGRVADLPPADHLGTVVNWAPLPDFDQAGQDPATAVDGGGIFTSPGQVPVGMINGPFTQVEAEDPFEVAVRLEMGRLRVREEAGLRMRDLTAARVPITIMDREALRLMPRSEPLIAGWLGRAQTARLYGPPGSGKSFAAIDMAACVALGRPWNGYAVQAGEVVYFAVEDAEGVALRLKAWEVHYEVEHRVHVVSTPVQMNVATVRRVLEALRAYFGDRPVALIVIDTQAMVTLGMDENSVQDMGVFIEAVKLLASQTGASVLTVHHSGVKGGRARGSSSVRGAMDVEIEAAMVGSTCTLSSTKQKNVADPPAIISTLHVVDLDESDALGQAVTSCVLLGPGAVTGPFTSPAGPALSPLHRRALAIATALVETAATGETYSRLRIRAAAITDFGKTSSSVTSTFSKAWAYLVERGRIAKAQGREAYYFIEVENEDRLATNPGKTVIGGPEVYVG